MFTQKPKHLYLHWPFCHTKCFFCDFVAFVQHEEFQERYAEKLVQEIEAFGDTFKHEIAHESLQTLFIGGGTPSICSHEHLEMIFDVLQKVFDFGQVKEITLESNPADIVPERLKLWRQLGINRLSIGVQCLSDKVLKSLNRHQTRADVFRAIESAPMYFENISVDLILGLPGINKKEWFDTLRIVLAWPIKHISIYFLTIHEKTPLYFSVQSSQTLLENDDVLAELYEETVALLEDFDFFQYEISNFARLGYASLHNKAYWDRIPYKGLGVAAASYDGSVRSVNTNNLGAYLRSDFADWQEYQTRETLTNQQHFMEVLMLSLRQKKGLDLHDVVYFLDENAKKSFFRQLCELEKMGLIEQKDEKVTLSARAMMLENEIVARLARY